MKRLGLALIVLFGLGSSSASADWHAGDYLLVEGGKSIGKQTFTLKRSEETGRMFMASKCETGFGGEAKRLSAALEVEADGAFGKYKTVQKRQGAKPLRGIFFIHKGQLRAIPQKGKSKPTDYELSPADLLVLDKRVLASWNFVAMRTIDKLGIQTLPVFEVGSDGVKSLTTETKGTAGIQYKGKFKEVTLLSGKGVMGNWLLVADKNGRVFGGKSGSRTFSLEGAEMGTALTQKEKAPEPNNEAPPEQEDSVNETPEVEGESEVERP